jgi:hypothetical protein
MKTISISHQATLSDEVLREVWRIKDELSASYNHDLERLFLDAQERQRLSGRKSVNIQKAGKGSATVLVCKGKVGIF